MKRNTQSNQYEISKCNPWIFWAECFFCNQEFRREAGWRFVLHGGFYDSYSCAECSTTREHLEDNIKKFKSIRPKAPPRNP